MSSDPQDIMQDNSLLQIIRQVNRKTEEQYYNQIWQLVGGNGVFFDRQIGGHIISNYEICSDLMACRERLSRASPPENSVIMGCGADSATYGFSVVRDMLFFERDEQKFIERKRVLISFLTLNSSLSDRIDLCAQNTIDKIPRRKVINNTDIYRIFREYNFQCSFEMFNCGKDLSMKLRRNILRAVLLFDSKILSKKLVCEAFSSIFELSEWITEKFELSGEHPEKIADLTMLLIAANESTAYLLFCYFRHRANLDNDSKNKESQILNECLRFDSPIQLIKRKAKVDFELDGHQINQGESIYLHIGAANRDPVAFREADKFRLERKCPPISFGRGISKCLGSGFSLMCARQFIKRVCTEYEVELDPTNIVYQHGLSGRGCRSANGNISRIHTH